MHTFNSLVRLVALAALTVFTEGPAAPGNYSLPMDLLEAKAADGGSMDAPPRLTKVGEIDYPRHLVDNGIYSGFVVSTLQIDTAGKVTGIKVTFASHPGFVRPALTKIVASKFAAAHRAGQPVASNGHLTWSFISRGRVGELLMGGTQRIPGKIPGLPPDYDYDTAPVLEGFCEPVYPRQLLEKEMKGEAAVRFILDDKGRVVTVELMEATHPDFGAALLAAVETWTFSPAQRKGVATKTVVETKQKFVPYGFRRPAAETETLKEWRRGGGQLRTPGQLDRPLHAIYRVEPRYPRALLAAKISGEVEIEAVVHNTGEVVLPGVIAATSPEFGWAALNAVQQWVFEPPRANGKPVSVRVKIPLSFAP